MVFVFLLSMLFCFRFLVIGVIVQVMVLVKLGDLLYFLCMFFLEVMSRCLFLIEQKIIFRLLVIWLFLLISFMELLCIFCCSCLNQQVWVLQKLQMELLMLVGGEVELCILQIVNYGLGRRVVCVFSVLMILVLRLMVLIWIFIQGVLCLFFRCLVIWIILWVEDIVLVLDQEFLICVVILEYEVIIVLLELKWVMLILSCSIEYSDGFGGLLIVLVIREGENSEDMFCWGNLVSILEMQWGFFLFQLLRCFCIQFCDMRILLSRWGIGLWVKLGVEDVGIEMWVYRCVVFGFRKFFLKLVLWLLGFLMVRIWQLMFVVIVLILVQIFFGMLQVLFSKVSMYWWWILWKECWLFLVGLWLKLMI